MKRLKALLRIAGCYRDSRIVSAADFAGEYDRIVNTYHVWNETILPSPEAVLRFDLLPEKSGLKIIDLACGTGHITTRLLSNLIRKGHTDFSVTGIDMAEELISHCRKVHTDSRLTFIREEGTAFLRSLPSASIDALYCGWAIPYFDRKTLLPLFRRVVRPGGLIGLISNARGTLRHVERAFVEVMLENPDSFHKVMDISSHLPRGISGLNRLMAAQGFCTLDSGKKEVELQFGSPGFLFNWLTDCGAIAGTRSIFRDPGEMKAKIIAKIGQYNGRKGPDGREYVINHRYVYGVYRRGKGEE